MNPFRVASVSSLSACFLFLGLPLSPLRATDFLRGDPNGDGMVTAADAHCLELQVWLGIACFECEDAADGDGNGRVNFADGMLMYRHLVFGEPVPAAPYPEVGPDPESDDELGCLTYGGSVYDDPGAQLRIVAAFASPGMANTAVIRIAATHSVDVVGYSGRIVDTNGALADARSDGAVPPAISSPNLIRIIRPWVPTPDPMMDPHVAQVKDGVLTFSALGSYFGNESHHLPGDDVPVIELTVPLRPDVPPGSYPLSFEFGELAVWHVGRGIRPELVSGTLEVRDHDVFLRGDCNGDGEIIGSPTDAIFLLNYNFSGTRPPPCLAACDANGDGEVIGQVTDAIYLLDFNFLGGPPPVAPFPSCGAGALASDVDLGCEAPPDCG